MRTEIGLSLIENTGISLVEPAAAVRTLADLAALLRHLRRRHAQQRRDSPLTYRELAGKTGWSAATICTYFTGRILPPTDRLDAVAALLGATPAELSALATARDRVEERRRVGAPAVGPAGAVPRQVPVDVHGFAGRSGEVARLDALLRHCGRKPSVAIAVVSGTAGVGKTALAVHWAHRMAGHFPDGLLYVNLRGFDPGGPPVDPAVAVRGLLDAFGVPAERIPVDPDAQVALYRSVLAGKRILLVADNARDAEQVRPLLPATAGCMAVVTSRNELAGLVAAEGGCPVVLGVLTVEEARQLLAGRLGARRVAAEPEAVDEIIRLTARLPLALAIVAARAAIHPSFALACLAAEVRDRRYRLDALAAGELGTDIQAGVTAPAGPGT